MSSTVRRAVRDHYLQRRRGWQVVALGLEARRRVRATAEARASRQLQATMRPPAAAQAPVVLAFPEVATPEVSVVIPVFGQWQLTRACLASLVRNAPLARMEVIVVDDASPDDTAAEVSAIPNLRLVRNAENLGFTRTANAGAAEARAPFIVFLNNDTTVEPGWLEGLLDAMGDASVGVAGSKLCFPSGLLQEAGALVWNDGSGWNLGRNRRPDLPQYNHRRDVDYCSGASLMVRTELFRRSGGFDERFAPAYYEDTDLCFTVRSLGNRVVYEPSSVVIHHEGGTHGTERRKPAPGAHGKHLQFRNRERFAEKWAAQLARHLPPPEGASLAVELGSSLSSPRPRVLYCDTKVPTPDADAGSHRAAWILRLLASMSDRVTMVPLDGLERGAYAEALRRDGVEVVPMSTLAFRRFARSRAGLYDVVVLSRPETAAAFLPAVRRHFPRATVLFDTTDLRFLRHERQLAVTGSVNEGHPDRTRAVELSVIDACDVTATVTDVEADVVRQHRPRAKVVVLPVVHPPRPDAPAPLAQRSGLLFIGSFQHEPNADAVVQLVDDILPRVRLHLPDVELVVIGADPPAHLMQSAPPGVHFTGWVPDALPLFDAARVFVAPLRFGAGMKGKNVQAMSLGLPLVTTRIGAEGMDLVDGEHAFVRDDAASFADAVVRLHTDDTLWSRIADAAREAATQRWSPESMRDRLVETVRA